MIDQWRTRTRPKPNKCEKICDDTGLGRAHIPYGIKAAVVPGSRGLTGTAKSMYDLRLRRHEQIRKFGPCRPPWTHPSSAGTVHLQQRRIVTIRDSFRDVAPRVIHAVAPPDREE